MKYRNIAADGDTAFITTTCLDFIPLFMLPSRASRMCQELIEVHHRQCSPLLSFVVMPEHIHWIAQVPEGRDVSFLVNRVKATVKHWLIPELTLAEQNGLGWQSGLNRRSVWQRSFRSYICNSESVLNQKIKYIHDNPVRRGLVETDNEFPWSTASFGVHAEWQGDFISPFTADDFRAIT